jgi:nucleoside-diphosphate-sugar epimerase
MDGAIMVTGGSGFIGQQVVRILAERGRTVVSVYHHKLPDSLDNVYPVCSDISSAELMAAPLRGVDTVIHLAWEGGLAGPGAPVKWHPASAEPMTRNAQTLQNLVTAMERAGTRRLIFLSAMGASRRAETPFLQEKYLAESLVLNSKIPEKIVMRTNVVFGGQGGNDRFLQSIRRVMKYPFYPVPKKSDGMAPIHVKDLAEILVNATEAKMSDEASVLEIQGSENYKVQDLFKIVSETYVKKTRFALGGVIGASLLPLLERDRRAGPQNLKLAHFLALASAGSEQTRVANPLTAVIPKKLGTFKERILD